jgi:hypothetical protein
MSPEKNITDPDEIERLNGYLTGQKRPRLKGMVNDMQSGAISLTFIISGDKPSEEEVLQIIQKDLLSPEKTIYCGSRLARKLEKEEIIKFSKPKLKK